MVMVGGHILARRDTIARLNYCSTGITTHISRGTTNRDDTCADSILLLRTCVRVQVRVYGADWHP